MVKPIGWRGSSLEDLRAFPDSARRDAGFQLRKLQRGEPPDDWRPFASVGPGTSEIRIASHDGWFRIMYVTKFEEAIYVLHCFRKSSRQTASGDVQIARKRFKALVADRKVRE